MSAEKKLPLEMFVIQKVREKREAAGMSQAALAFRMEVSPGFIGRVESPRQPHKYNISHVNQLAIIFKCSPRDFFPEYPL